MLNKFKPSADDMKIIRKLDMHAPYTWLATWFGLGFLKPAPGTWGSLGALPFGLLLIHGAGLKALLAGIIIITALGVMVSKQFEMASGVHDSKMIVIDEVAGQWIALTPLVLFESVTGLGIILAFLLFRFFDILKPWPIRAIDQKMQNAVGVMLDDIIAGLCAALLLTTTIKMEWIL